MRLDPKIPNGPIAEKWTRHKNTINVVGPANKRNIDIIVVGTGLAGGSASASLAEMGYNVKAFCYQDSPRRAHSIAAQGGINAAKNYQNDGDSIYRLFYDTVKGGDYRSREANVHRLAEVSVNIIDQCVAQGVPFARDYGGLLDNRSFGGVLVSRTFYARGQTGQQLLLGAYSAMNRQIAKGKIKMYNRHEMVELVKVKGKARGIIARNLVTGQIERHSAHAVVIASGGYALSVHYSGTAANPVTHISGNARVANNGSGLSNKYFSDAFYNVSDNGYEANASDAGISGSGDATADGAPINQKGCAWGGYTSGGNTLHNIRNLTGWNHLAMTYSAGVMKLYINGTLKTVSYTHLRAHETLRYLVCRLLL